MGPGESVWPGAVGGVAIFTLRGSSSASSQIGLPTGTESVGPSSPASQRLEHSLGDHFPARSRFSGLARAGSSVHQRIGEARRRGTERAGQWLPARRVSRLPQCQRLHGAQRGRSDRLAVDLSRRSLCASTTDANRDFALRARRSDDVSKERLVVVVVVLAAAAAVSGWLARAGRAGVRQDSAPPCHGFEGAQRFEGRDYGGDRRADELPLRQRTTSTALPLACAGRPKGS